MEAKSIKTGESPTIADRCVKNEWRWAWIEETGRDGKQIGTWRQKVAEHDSCCFTRVLEKACVEPLFHPVFLPTSEHISGTKIVHKKRPVY